MNSGASRFIAHHCASMLALRVIYYDFGSKETLYVAALEQSYADFVAAERA